MKYNYRKKWLRESSLGGLPNNLKKLLLDNCDFKVRINITKSTLIDSLNVSNAAAITLFEFRKK